jgi:hypothetical protein
MDGNRGVNKLRDGWMLYIILRQTFDSLVMFLILSGATNLGGTEVDGGLTVKGEWHTDSIYSVVI